MRLLVIAPNWIGDTLLAQPLLARLRARHPGLRIDAVAPDWTAPVLRRMREIEEVFEVPFRHGELALGARLRLAGRLRRRRYGEAIVLPNSLKSALVPFFAGIPRRIGFRGEAYPFPIPYALPGPDLFTITSVCSLAITALWLPGLQSLARILDNLHNYFRVFLVRFTLSIACFFMIKTHHYPSGDKYV